MKTVLQITPCGVSVVDSYGDAPATSPELMLFCRADIEFDLRGTGRRNSGELEKFSIDPENIGSWYFAIDRDFDASTAPKLLIISNILLECSESETILKIAVPNTGTEALVSDMAGSELKKYTAEIGGINLNGDICYTWQFEITVKNRIYSGNGMESIAKDPDYYTAVQTNALLAAKADRNDVYTRNESDTLLTSKADRSDVYVRNEIDAMLGNVENLLAEI